MTSTHITHSLFVQIDPKLLKPHPRNQNIYGVNENVSDLVAALKLTREVESLIATPKDYFLPLDCTFPIDFQKILAHSELEIISGHRRAKALIELGWKEVSVEIRLYPNEEFKLQAILASNITRVKTTEQLVREGQAWEEVESKLARKRQIDLAGTRPNSQPDLTANLPEGQGGEKGEGETRSKTANLPEGQVGEKGETRSKAAFWVGMKTRTYSNATRVVERIDAYLANGHHQSALGLSLVLNRESVDAAYRLLKINESECQTILEKIASGKAPNSKIAKMLLNKKTFKNNFCNDFDSEGVEFAPHLYLRPGVVVEISGTTQDFINYRLGRIHAVSEKTAEVWFRHIDSMNMHLHTFKHCQLTPQPMSEELQQINERINKLRQMSLDPFEIDILSLLDRPVYYRPKELEYLEYLENIYGFSHINAQENTE